MKRSYDSSKSGQEPIYISDVDHSSNGVVVISSSQSPSKIEILDTEEESTPHNQNKNNQLQEHKKPQDKHADFLNLLIESSPTKSPLASRKTVVFSSSLPEVFTRYDSTIKPSTKSSNGGLDLEPEDEFQPSSPVAGSGSSPLFVNTSMSLDESMLDLNFKNHVQSSLEEEIVFANLEQSDEIVDSSSQVKFLVSKPSANPAEYLAKFDKKTLAKCNISKRDKKVILEEMTINTNDVIIKQCGMTEGDFSKEFEPSKVRAVGLDAIFDENDLARQYVNSCHLDGVPSLRVASQKITTKFNLITWSRKADKMFSKSHQCFLPLDVTVNLLESTVAIYYGAEDLVADFKDGTFLKEFRSLKAVPFFEQSVLLLTGYDSYISKLKRKINREYTESVRGVMASQDVPRTSSTKRTKELEDSIKQIETLILDLQLTYSVPVFRIETTASFARWLKSFTYSIGSTLYDNNSLVYQIGTVKSGSTPKDSYQLALQQLTFVSSTVADKIAAKYPSFMKLYLRTLNKNSLGSSLDGKNLTSQNIEKTILNLMNSENPDEILG